MKCFSIYDCKAYVFNVPFFSVSSGVASRMFFDLVSDSGSIIHAHPSDFTLYEIGDFDEKSGLVISYDKPDFVCSAGDLAAIRSADDE